MSLNDETCKAEIEAVMGELVDLLAAFQKADIDPRVWSQLSVYVPRVKRLETAINRYLADDFSCNGGAEQMFNEAMGTQ